jgi:uncharacterized protein YxeA
MMKILLIIAIALMPSWAVAQKKELGQARAYIKSGKDYDKAEKLMTDLLKDSANRKSPRVYQTWYQAVRGQYEAANEKLYLKQKYDTAAFFNLVYRMYTITETLDSLDAQPDEKGRTRLEFRKDNAEDMDELRPNLYYGGTYSLRRNNHDEAFRFFDMYLDTDRQPLFAGYNYLQNDTLMATAAYWATFCGFKLQDPKKTLKYATLALRDENKAAYTLQYMAEAYRLTNDEKAYLETLRQGFEHFPTYAYFFPRLADHYSQHQQNDSALVLANQALKSNPYQPIFLLAKSLTLLSMERYDECIKVSKLLIEKDPGQAHAYFNIATAYLNQALALEKKNEPRLYKQRLSELYTAARPYMEKYRTLAPADKGRWAPALYRIYLALNLGKQFDEIDQLLKNATPQSAPSGQRNN